MESPNRQAVKLLREQRRRRKRVMAFLCMAGVVVVGTIMALRMSGRAMNNMVLDCVLSHNLPHQHTETCYYTPPQDEAQKLLVCGTVDFVVHKHDPEDCFDKMGNLICMLPEIEEHVHTEECYQEQRVLSCTLEEGVGHQHSDGCYGPDYSSEPVCGVEETEEHIHDENCHDEDGQLICGQEENGGHTHSDSCYPKKLVCGHKEGDGGHIHSDACYSTEAILACGKNEVHLHTHTEECYLHTVDQPDQVQAQELAEIGIDINKIVFADSGELPAEGNRVLNQSGAHILKCGQLQVTEHIHDDSCYTDVNTEGEILSQLESGSESADMPGQRTAVYQSANMRVTAIYDGNDFPESARVNIERVDEGSGLPEKQEQLSKVMLDDELQLKALLKVTVSGIDDVSVLSEPIRMVVEPVEQGQLTVAAWYDNSSSLADEGIYVQGEDAELKLLETAEHESGGFATEVYAGALVGIAQQPAQEDSSGSMTPDTKVDSEGVANTVLYISQSFKYEDDNYTMIFHIDGTARPKSGEEQSEETQDEPVESKSDIEAEEPTEPKDSEDSSNIDTDSSDIDEGIYFTEPTTVDDQTEESSSSEEPGETVEHTSTERIAGTAEPALDISPAVEPTAEPIWDDEPAEMTVTISEDTLPANVLDDPGHPLGFMVEKMPVDSPEYELYLNSIPSDNGETGLPNLQVMSYSLYYKGVEFDLSQCTVTLEVTVSESVLEAAKELENEGDSSTSVSTNVAVATFLSSKKISILETDESAIYSMPVDGTKDMQVADEGDSFRESIENAMISDDITMCSFDEINEINLSTRTVISEPAAQNDESDTNSSDDQYVGIGVFTGQNPQFMIQYYAWLNVVDDTDNNGPIKVIDTTGKNLPKNGVTPKVKSLSLEADGSIKTRPVAMKIYSDIDATYLERPNLQYLAPTGSAADNYELKQIWVLKPEIKGVEGIEDIEGDVRVKYKEDDSFRETVDSATGDDINKYWITYGTACGDKAFTPTKSINVEKDMHLTNRPDSAADNRICISQDDVLRLVYEPKIMDETENLDNTPELSASFFDYDISDNVVEKNGVNTMESTSENGINSPNNYKGSGTKYTFGNANTGNINDNSKYHVTWSNNGKDNKINSRNREGGYGTPDNSYMGCAFGMVTGLNLGDKSTNATPIFDAGINAPDIFGNSSLNGKHDHSGSLKFKQVGDTHTLSIASVDGASTLSGLEKFSNPSIYDGVQNSSKIWTNNFWPMDNASGAIDFMFGEAEAVDDGNGKKKATSLGKQKFNGINATDANLPISDDLLNHNSYFGMHFAITFDLEEIYEGPLEYLFFGDDDMWVFLTDEKGKSTLICDIGGVHSSVGEMVNLRDYLSIGSEGTYRLDFFYTERGASGSTCWMQYTLPSVRDVENPLTDDDYRMLKFGKKVEREIVDGGYSTETKKEKFDTDETFLFQLTLRDSEGKQDFDDYNYYTYEYVNDENGNPVKTLVENASGFIASDTLFNGASFPLKAGQWIEIPKMHVGTKYTIKELGVVDWDKTTSDGNQINYVLKKREDQEHDYEVSESGTLLEDKSFSGEISEDTIPDLTFTNTFKAYQLPETGGMGTWGFTGAGTVMLLAAGCLLVRKRMNKD